MLSCPANDLENVIFIVHVWLELPLMEHLVDVHESASHQRLGTFLRLAVQVDEQMEVALIIARAENLQLRAIVELAFVCL